MASLGFPGSRAARATAALVLALLLTVVASATTRPLSDVDARPLEPDAFAIATLTIPDEATLDAVVRRGFDLDHDLVRDESGITVSAVVSGAGIAELEAIGVQAVVRATAARIEATRLERLAEREAAIAAHAASESDPRRALTDEVAIARADYFTSTGESEFLSVEAKSSDGAGATLTVEWDAGPGTAIGDGGSAELDPFVDAGVYLYHRGQYGLNDGGVLEIADGPAAGTYVAIGASFGAPLDPAGATGTVELVDDGSGDPTEGCGPLVGFTAGNVALLDRGVCTFTDKVANAQAAGAAAAIVANNNAGEPFVMSGVDPSIAIPAAMISQADGATIRAALPASGTLRTVDVLPAPTRVRVTSSAGGSAEAVVAEWLPSGSAGPARPYFAGFLDHYADAHEAIALIEDLHAEFPTLTEIIELPHETNGYRRRAMHLSEGASSQRVVLTSHAWGHEGGNDLTIAYTIAGTFSAPLSVSVAGDEIVVQLATDAGGTPTSTAAAVAAAINGSGDASALVTASTYRGNAGTGVVQPGGPDTLTDGLSAPASVPREPFRVKALRIGKHRDGSRTGVLSYSQAHAREWQTPLVNLETAYRLLRNYRTDSATRQLVDNLDIFIIPVVNPDGALYSFYDFASQRKNMTNYCGAGEPDDFNAREAWGVDNDRNHTVGSLYDGYDGASTSCTSAVYAGPFEESEPESRNITWLADTYPNIKFAMDIHSSGNYFMWSPGAYIASGRITLPRPDLGTERYFQASAERILSEVKEWRGLTVSPARTGPIADVLYSAAGNSGDALWYDRGIYALRVEVGTSFQPEWDEAFNEMMEFSNGLVELYRVAKDWSDDRRPPRSRLVQPGSGRYPAPVAVGFDASEPATIYYTLDGSNPTYASPRYEAAGIREGGAMILINATTTIKWFSVDASGNVERNYVPGSNGANRERIVITGL